MQSHCFADLLADRVERVQRRHRFLENHRDVVAANSLHLAIGQRAQVLALEADLAADDLAGRARDQPQDGERRYAFATAGFANHRQRLARVHLVGDAIDRLDEAGRSSEMCLQIVDLENDPVLLRCTTLVGAESMLIERVLLHS